jgi:hypothetical protein
MLHLVAAHCKLAGAVAEESAFQLPWQAASHCP